MATKICRPNPVRFLFMGLDEGEVYRRKEDTRDELLELIMDVIARIKEGRDALRRATHPVLALVAKCTEVDGGIFENVLH
jgi:hypothetical protein